MVLVSISIIIAALIIAQAIQDSKPGSLTASETGLYYINRKGELYYYSPQGDYWITKVKAPSP